MRTKNKIALESLIDNINTTFFYIGAKGDDVDQFEIDQLHKFVDQFASEVTISDSQGEYMKSSYQEWTEEVLNTHLRLSSITPTRKVEKYTRAGMWGKTIVCPECNKVTTVYHFSWSALSCQHCDTMINKRHWWTLK